MDYQKLDSRLALAYDDPSARDTRYAVFVRTKAPLTEEALRELERLGVAKPNANDSIFTMELSTRDAAALTDRPWVVSIRSSNQLRPLSP